MRERNSGVHRPNGRERASDLEGGRDALETFVLLREWQDHLLAAGRLSEKTCHQYLRAIVSFEVEVVKPLREIAPADIVQALKITTSRGGRRDQLLKALFSFYRWAHDAHGFDDPTTEFGFRHHRPGRADYLNHEELDRLFAGAEYLDPRARPTIELLYGTAARIHSVTELRPADIDLEHRIVHFVLGVKNGATYSLPLGPRAYAAALRLLELQDFTPRYGKRRPDKLIGVGDQSVRNWLQAASAKAALDKRVYPHLLRHSALTHLANDPEVSVATIVEVAGWADPTPFRRYAAARPGAVKKALARL
jgi:integrase